MFNPWLQGKKYDPDCVYIKKYCPELEKFTPRQIHNGEATTPIVDHTQERELTFKLYSGKI
jgi:deoxyribodipyrimidine photo-lyase